MAHQRYSEFHLTLPKRKAEKIFLDGFFCLLYIVFTVFYCSGANYDPKLKPKKLNKREKEKAAKQMERLFAWVPDKMKVR